VLLDITQPVLIPKSLRLKNDLIKDNPYLLTENEGYGKSMIDTDAQVIILMNIIYVVTVGTLYASNYGLMAPKRAQILSSMSSTSKNVLKERGT
jgi:hypothetical protein